MSCAHWSVLVRQDERLLREGSAEREAAERHFRACPSCAERAFLLDPSWAVARESSSPAVTAEVPRVEILELERKILDAGRFRDLEGSVRRAPLSMRVAAAAALAAVLLAGGVLLGTNGWSWRTDLTGPQDAPASVGSPAIPIDARDFFADAAAVQLSLPAVGSLAPEAARIYDLGQDDFALVMVVHETLDL